MSHVQVEISESMQAILETYGEFNTIPLEKLSPDHARQQPALTEAVRAVAATMPIKRGMVSASEPVGMVEHRLIAGKGNEILLRVYTPVGQGPFPVLLYFHGGGWVIANLDAYDSSCRSLTNLAECIVVSVAYSQAPEHKYPSAIEEGFSTYQWLLDHAQELNGDPTRIAVGGESAGGNIATVVTRMCGDRNVRSPLHQLLIYPVTDFSFDTPSYVEHADAKPLNREMMKWFARHYLNHEAEASHPYVSPLRALEFSNLPSATVITAQIDPLQSEGEAYAKKLEEAGVEVRFRNFEGVTHEFFGMKSVLEEAKEANEFAAEGLISAFNKK